MNHFTLVRSSCWALVEGTHSHWLRDFGGSKGSQLMSVCQRFCSHDFAHLIPPLFFSSSLFSFISSLFSLLDKHSLSERALKISCSSSLHPSPTHPRWPISHKRPGDWGPVTSLHSLNCSKLYWVCLARLIALLMHYCYKHEAPWPTYCTTIVCNILRYYRLKQSLSSDDERRLLLLTRFFKGCNKLSNSTSDIMSFVINRK